MTRSDRFREAVAALDAHRRAEAARHPDLFTVTTREPDAWQADALAAIRDAALRHRELTVEDIGWPAAVDNRARGWALREAARRGWLRALGWIPASADRHGRPVRLWASLIYTPTTSEENDA